MSSFMSYFGGRRDNKQAARDAIVGLRQQLQMIEKKEEYLQKKIDEELKKAKANAVSNKAGASVITRPPGIPDAIRLVAPQSQPKRCAGRRLARRRCKLTTLESANLNAETMQALKKASDVLSGIHGYMTMDKVDATLSKIAEQREIATEIADAISGPIGAEVADEVSIAPVLQGDLTFFVGRAQGGARATRTGALGRTSGWRRTCPGACPGRRTESGRT
ncbi:hypothetical protein EDD15DRAFT_2221440 [Pisolithus albus]|nr:hypothetical protein EDD15DRAFT_2221440 [Pisolithus albus]